MPFPQPIEQLLQEIRLAENLNHLDSLINQLYFELNEREEVGMDKET